MKPEQHLYTTLSAPAMAQGIPENSQWLAGEGAGSWFNVELAGKEYRITRYSPEGKIECAGFFNILDQASFDINSSFEFVHLSHCKSVTIKQMDQIIKFQRIA